MDEQNVNAPHDLDAAPEEGLESIFVLPEHMREHPQVSRWYDDMVENLRADASGVPMKTVQYTLMERIAYSYADMRYKELNDPNRSARERRDDNSAWLSMVEQFNRLLEKHNDKIVNDMLLQVQSIMKEVLSTISDPTERKRVMRAMQEQFANFDL